MKLPFQILRYLQIGFIAALIACAPASKDDSQQNTVDPEAKVLQTDSSEISAVDETASATALAHDFTLHTLNGDVVTLSEQQGEWVLVNFWATWCVYCV
ncbi:MAG: TlpA disulfide reductase family protein, partial [Chloroflexota bacterium]